MALGTASLAAAVYASAPPAVRALVIAVMVGIGVSGVTQAAQRDTFGRRARRGEIRRGRQDRRIAHRPGRCDHRRAAQREHPLLRRAADAALGRGRSRVAGPDRRLAGGARSPSVPRRSSRRKSTSSARATVRQTCRPGSTGRRWCRSAAARSRCTMASAATGTARPCPSRRRAYRASACRRDRRRACAQDPAWRPTMRTVRSRSPRSCCWRRCAPAPTRTSSSRPSSTPPIRSRTRRRCASSPAIAS